MSDKPLGDPPKPLELPQRVDTTLASLRRLTTIWLLMLSLTVLIVVVVNIYLMLSLRDLSQENHEILEIVQDATGPEGQARSAEVIQALLKAIDCDRQPAVIEVLNAIWISEGIEPPQRPPDDSCPPPPIEG